MLTHEQALRRLLAGAMPTDGETVRLEEAAGRVLVDPRVVAGVDVPPFDNSAMDGFALRADDTPGVLHLAGEVAAGAGDLPTVERGTAVRIMTGAPMPPGANAIVPMEQAREDGERVEVPAPAVSGAHVRLAGHDTRAGDEVCLPGMLSPAGVAVLATLGLAEVTVRRRPRVAILSTGDELAAPGTPLGPGMIHDANGVALAAAVAEAGGDPMARARVGDERVAVESALADAAAAAELVVTSGGVSVGRHDEVRSVLEERGTLDFWRIAVQPGKPLAVGAVDGVTLVGLPGNPVSALVTFELFVRPLILAMVGLHGDGRLHLRARPETAIPKDPARRAFLRVSVWAEDGVVWARSAGGQGSSQVRPMADANALLVVPEGEAAADPSIAYEVIVLDPHRLDLS